MVSDEPQRGPESAFHISFTKISEQIFKWWRDGVVTLTEARENLRMAGLYLGDDSELDPEPIRLPRLDDSDDMDLTPDGVEDVDGDDLDDESMDYEEAA